MAPLVDWGFADGGASLSDVSTWLALYAFAFQIYGDFSGYTDIARGIAKVMGFDLARNFKAPYLVSSPAAFWRNWHITLSEWLRDYLYIPLGGNRGGVLGTCRNLTVTMLLGGLWHGAGIAYLAWGLYHGMLLVFYRVGELGIGQVPRINPPRVFRVFGGILSIFIFFHLTCFGWLLFRAGSVADPASQWTTIDHLSNCLVSPGLSHGWMLQPVLIMGLLTFLVQAFSKNLLSIHPWPLHRQAFAIDGMLTVIAIFGQFKGSSFIYFQF